MITDPIKIAELIVQGVEGTTNDVMAYIDQLIDDNEICGTTFTSNEMFIIQYVDDCVFQCEVCGWTLSINELEDAQICASCWEDEGNDTI